MPPNSDFTACINVVAPGRPPSNPNRAAASSIFCCRFERLYCSALAAATLSQTSWANADAIKAGLVLLELFPVSDSHQRRKTELLLDDLHNTNVGSMTIGTG